MFYVYVIQNPKNKQLYFGCTSNLTKRIIEHNSNKSFATKGKGPYELIYFEGYKAKADAFEREHQLKLRTNAMTGLKRRIWRSLGAAE